MTKLERLELLMKELNAEPFEVEINSYKSLITPEEKEYKYKNKKNCSNSDCNKLIISLNDLKTYLKYNICEQCNFKKEN